jgi:leucyl-tRNA synthetase
LFQKNNIEIVDDINVISKELNIAFNKFVKDATNNMEEYKHNLVISDMMVYINACYNVTKLYKKHVEGFLTILSCFAPFLSEELNETILHINTSITKSI